MATTTKRTRKPARERLAALVAQMASVAREVATEGGSCTSPEEAVAHLEARVPFLDARRRVIGHEVVSVGTATATLVHPREVFRPAIACGAVSVLVAHNHPSGDPNPSHDDRLLTERLNQAAKLLGFSLDDHIVVGTQGHVSFRQMGLLTYGC